MKNTRRSYTAPRWRLFVRTWLGLIIGSLALLTLGFGLGGFSLQHAQHTQLQTQEDSEPTGPKAANADQASKATSIGGAGRWTIPLFKTIQLYLLNSGTDDDRSHPDNILLDVARITAALLFLVVSSTIIFRVVEEVGKLPRQLTQSNHVVICGLGQIGLQILGDLNVQSRASQVIVIENNANNPWLDYARSLGASVVIGDCTNANTLVEARITKSAEVFIVTGDDSVNLEVSAELGMLLDGGPKRKEPVRFYVHVVDSSLATTLRPYCSILHDTKNLEAQVFNALRTAAARLVTEQLPKEAPREPNEVAHYVILGFGSMGRELALQLAHLGHFANRKRSRFTIADSEMDKSARRFLSRNCRFTAWTDRQLGVPSFSENDDSWDQSPHPMPPAVALPHGEAIQYVCNAQFKDLPVGRCDESFVRSLVKEFKKPGVKPCIFVCSQRDHDNFETSVHLREQLSHHGMNDVPIFVWMPRQPALAATLRRDGRFHPFGECRSSASYSEITAPVRETIGQAIHDDYERRKVAQDPTKTAASWADSGDDYRESSRMAADHMLIKLDYLGLRLSDATKKRPYPMNLDFIMRSQFQVLAEMEHNRWVAERLLTGWRYGPKAKSKEGIEADKEKKISYNLIPWSSLTDERKKDFDQVKKVLVECQNKQIGFSIEVADSKKPAL